MPTNIINRSDAEALIQSQLSASIVQKPIEESVVLRLGRRMPNMTSNQTRIRVLDALPMAYWVNGDTGMKQTSKQAWDNVYIDAEELAVIIPIPEAVIADASIDIMGEVEPRVREAVGKAIDGAVLFGINKPAHWRMSVIDTARQAGNNVAPGASPDYYDKLLGVGGVIAKVEESGAMVNGVVASMATRAVLRGIRDNQGGLIFKSDMQGPTPYALDGAPMYFPLNGSFDQTRAQLIAGDFSQLVYAVRQDIEVKILDQAVIQDPITKEIVYNLAQQDMIALRVTFRMGWALPNPVTAMDSDRVSVPFAYLEPAQAVTTQTVTVTVTDNSDDADPIPGAYVEINGARKKTNASGVAVFTLTPGNYTMKVKASGYSTVSDAVSVASSAVNKTIVLTASV